MSTQRTYIAIDLKSFFASVECVERGLNPLTTNLTVADASRTNKTICLAVSPSLKAYGIGGRPRLFELEQLVAGVNRARAQASPDGRLHGRSVHEAELAAHPDWAVAYITAPPQMAKYIQYSTRVYGVYLKHIAPEDIHVYSIDEVFIDATAYLATYRMTARQLAMTMIRDVLATTGITATAGIGTNLYLSKIAMDIVAKHIPPDSDGVRIASLDESSYRRQLWGHRPLTSFWRVGAGTAARLEAFGLHTMGDVARQSLKNDELLYQLFGVNAELLIDHAWGWEPCTIADIKAYRPETNSLSSGQVLAEPYTAAKALVVVQEMAESLALSLLDKRLTTTQVSLYVGYDTSSLARPGIRSGYTGPTVTDHYGRPVPKPAHATTRLAAATSSTRQITQAVVGMFGKIVQPQLLVRRLNISLERVSAEVQGGAGALQLSLFDDTAARVARQREALGKERRMQEAVLQIKKQFGKNAILRGLNFQDGATARDRNQQIGGHKA